MCRFSGLLGASSGDATLLKAMQDRPEDIHLVDESTRGAIEQQLMAYLTVIPRFVPHFDGTHSFTQANSDHLSSYLTSQRVSNMLDVSLQVPITPQV